MCTNGLRFMRDTISDNVEISVIEIENLNGEVQELLDYHFVSICEGNSGTSLSIAKQRVLNLYNSKMNDVRWLMGATAEFFIHLYINTMGFKQECLFVNLEERSIKKGFDGYYSKNNIEWVMESKSGSIETEGNCHVSKIKEAFSDLEKKFLGRCNNDPWHNAYSHASLYDVGTSEEIRKNIKKMSDDFIQGTFYSIDKFNIIPCATIFLTNIWNPKSNTEIASEIKDILEDLEYKKLHIICVTQKSADLFLEYIGVSRS